MGSIIFDIETGPLPEAELLERIEPFDESAFKHPGEFDPFAVKYGQTKDPVKRAEKLEECRKKHAHELATYAQRLEAARIEHITEQTTKAALHPELGQVLAIGFQKDDSQQLWFHDEADGEEDLLRKFWDRYQRIRSNNFRLIGFNIFEFDLRFLVVRSWIRGVPIPQGVLVNDRYWPDHVIDLQRKWKVGTNGKYPSLDLVARALGVGKKDGDGANFHRLLREDRPRAVEYLRNDLELTARVASRLGVV